MGLFFRVLVKLAEKFFYRQFMDGYNPVETSDCKVGFSFLDPPVLNPRQIIVISEVFVTTVTLSFTKFSKSGTDSL